MKNLRNSMKFNSKFQKINNKKVGLLQTNILLTSMYLQLAMP